ncbi:hypothetical protein VSDG_02970 [Cytospora chrysosperma]|uniref:Uncharacterized protein n=1 Tax=Cytospora chrysosperma TaxID=252740 RepID=A0A423W904_CYTCH|nr:hypothetical protein VSDG_02970 [Valsa sordida]
MTRLAPDYEQHELKNDQGIMAFPKGQTKDGFESQFGTNHLLVSSGAQRRGKINFDDLNVENTEYTPLGAYDQ